MSQLAGMQCRLLLAVVGVASVFPLAAQERRDERVLAQGAAVAAFEGTDAGQGGSNLRLTSLGRWRDERGVERFTFWRLRNSGDTARLIRLDAPGSAFSVGLALPARTETFLRSPIVEGAATHRLFESGAQVDVKASGATAWSDATPAVAIAGANRPPLILSVPGSIAEVGEPYRYPVIVFDADNDRIALSAHAAPAGFGMSPSTRMFTFVATAAQRGGHAITIRADDGRGGVANQAYALQVVSDFCPLLPIALPDARLAALSPPATVAELPRGGATGQFAWLTWDGAPNAPTLAASLQPPGDSWRYVDPDDAGDVQPDPSDWVQGAPGNMAANAVAAAMDALRGLDIVVPSWDAVRGQGNRFDYRIARFARIRLTAFQSAGNGSLSFEFRGWTDCYDDAPRVTDQALSTTRDQPLDILLGGSDPEGAPLTFAVLEAPRNGALSGTPPRLTYTPAAGYVGTDRFTFRASDGTKSSEPGVVQLTIGPGANRAPVAAPATVGADEDVAVPIVLAGTDPDGDALSFRIVRETERGTLSGTPPNLVYQPRANLSGDDELYFRVSDGTLESASARVLIQVRAVDDPPVAMPLALSTDEDVALPLRLRGEDVDTPVLSFAVASPPARGVLEGTPPDLTYRPAADFAGEDGFTYIARDAGTSSAPATVRITVRPKNDPPRITSTPPATAAAGIEYRYDVDALDIDGDVLRFALVRRPDGMAIDAATGLIRWTPPANQAWPVEVVVDALDPAGLFDKQTFLIAAAAVNVPPTIVSTAPTVATVGATYTYDVDASDADGDRLTYALTARPAGMAIDAASGVIAWTPDAAAIGPNNVTVQVGDGRGGEASQSFVVAVSRANRPPAITSTPSTRAAVGERYTYDADAIDPDGDALTFTLSGAPAGATIDAASGLVGWTPGSAQAGPQSMTVRVSDGRGGSAEQAVALTVAPANQPPRFTTAPATLAVVGSAWAYDADAIDPDGDAVQFALRAGPAGLVVDAATGVLAWTPAAAGESAIRLVATDGRGGEAVQDFTLVAAVAPPAASNLGTAFWLMFMANARVESIEPQRTVVVSAPTGAEVVVEAPGIGFTTTVSIAAGALQRIDLPLAVTHNEIDAVRTLGVRVTATRPVVVTALNANKASSDGFLALPDHALGRSHHVLAVDYYNESRFTGMLSGVVATENGTQVTLVSPVEWRRADGTVVPARQPVRVVLDRGQTFLANFVTGDARRGSSGVRVLADRPVAVYSGAECTSVPYRYSYCDHHVEQSPPDDALGFRFSAIPVDFRRRGDVFRVLAVESGTRVQFNGVEVATLGAGEYVERLVDQGLRIVANRPVLVAQLPTSATFHGVSTRDSSFLFVPPEESALAAYAFATPGPRLQANGVNVIIDRALRASLRLNGAPAVAGGTEFAIPGTDRVGLRIALANGTHALSADGPFLATYYGFGQYEGSAFAVGMRVGATSAATAIALSPREQQLPVGAEACVRIGLTDGAAPAAHARWRVALAGTRTLEDGGFTAADGSARYCWRSAIPGRDTATIAAAGLVATAGVQWIAPTGNSAPVILSTPRFVPTQRRFDYIVEARDPDGDTVAYSLTDAPTGMVIDPRSGVIAWTPPVPAPERPGIHAVTVRAADPAGLHAEQRFVLTVADPPLFERYPADETRHPDVYRGQVATLGGDPWSVDLRLLAGPPGASIGGAIGGLQPVPLPGQFTATWLPGFADVGQYLDAFNPMCRRAADDIDGLWPAQVWRASGLGALTLPVVGRIADTNADGRVDAGDDLAIVALRAGYLVALNARSGAVLWTNTQEVFSDRVLPAIADLDGDGAGEILAATGAPGSTRQLVALDGSGRRRWLAATPIATGEYRAVHTSIQVADLLPASPGVEIVAGPVVYAASGQSLWAFPEQPSTPQTLYFLYPLIADLDADGSAEVLFRNEVRRADGTPLFTLDAIVGVARPGVNFAVIQADADPGLEVVAMSNRAGGLRALHLLDGDGRVIWGPLVDGLQDSVVPGVPEVGDLDADGRDDVYLGHIPAVVDLDEPRVRSMATPALKPNYGTLVDLNGDGRYETAPRDGRLFVDAASGYAWTANAGVSAPLGGSGIAPIAFADLDGDGTGEAIVAFSDGLVAYRGSSVRWQAPAQSPSQFRVAAMRGAPAIPARARTDGLADLHVGAPKLSGAADAFAVRVAVANRGPAAAAGGFDVELWGGAPPTGTRLAVRSLDRLASGERREVGFEGLRRDQLRPRMYARIIARAAVAECESRNNEASSHLFDYALSDGNGYADRYTHLVAVNQDDFGPQFETIAPADAVVGAPYRYQPLVATALVGSGLRYELRDAPAGMTVNAFTGEIRWMPSPSQLGRVDFSIHAVDLNGRNATQFASVTVVADGANRPPLITSTAPRDARPSSLYVYDLEAHDPDLDVLTYRLRPGAPPAMQIDSATGRITWNVPATQFGGAGVTVEVSDGRGGVATQFISMGIYPTVANMAPYFTSTPPAAARVGEAWTYRPTTADPDGDPVQVAIASAPPGAALGADGAVQWVPTEAQAGRQLIRLRAVDDDGASAIQDAWIDVAGRAGALTVAIAGFDADVTEVTRPEAITGLVAGENLREWRLGVRPANSPDATVEFIATGTATVANTRIATFDPTLRMNGLYAVILQAWGTDGQTAFDSRVFRVTGDMKVGHFSLTFEDVSIDVAGLPVRVTRTYDTRQRGEALDFGFGWSVDYQNVRLRESRKLGLSWYTVPQQLSTCVRANGDPTVAVTLPDGEVHTFRARAQPECTIGGQAFVNLVFEPVDGTDSRLEQTSYGLLRLVDVVGTQVKNIVDIDDIATPVDPRLYRLTTPEGLVYEIDQSFGVRRIIEPGGQSLTYTSQAIVHSTGVKVDIRRDANGRISDLVLPDGEVLSYTYTGAGDLESFTDELDRVTTYAYTATAHPHYLTEIADPRGIRVARNEYDAEGRLVRTIDAEGNVIAFERALGSRTETVRDRNGNATLYVYDDEGRVLTETNALGETITRTYDADGNVLTETNPLGQATTRTYDPRGNVLTETNALGERTTSTYDARNNLLTQADAAGVVVMRNTYGAFRSNNLTRTEDALGNATEFLYDGQTGGLLRMSDAAGLQTHYAVDERGWRTRETDALGNVTRYGYDVHGRVRVETRTRIVDGASEPLVTRHTYDAAGNLTRTEHPDGSVTTTEYSAIDKPVRECDALVRCTTYTYDRRGNPLRTTHPDGTYEEMAYDANGNTVATRDRGGRVTRMAYDAANRLLETILPDPAPASGDDGDPDNNPRIRNAYDRAGRLVATVDENGRRTTYAYDAAGRRTHVVEPAVDGSTATTVNAYDASGRRIAVTDALGRTTRFEYDAAGRMTATIHPDGGPDDGNDANNPRTRVAYDALGRKTAETDPDGRRTEYAYDALGRLATVALAAGTPSATTTTYAYDAQGNRITQTDAEGRSLRFTYDTMGRETSRTLPLGQRETKTWTAAGEPASVTDFNGRTTRWTHDDTGRVVGIDYPNDADVTFAYTPTGQRATAVDGHGTTTQSFDPRDRLVRRVDSAGRAIEYTWDPKGNLLSRVTASQSLVYAYDARDRLVSVTSTVAGGTPRTTRYTYDEVGLRTGMIAADGTTTAYTYDRRNRLVGLVQRTAAAALLFGATYTVDATGLRTAAQESDASGVVRTLSWSYDALKRLVGEAIDHRDDTRDRTSTWTYDRVGNRLSQTVTQGTGAAARSTVTTSTYDANDRLTQESVRENGGAAELTSFTYDAQGNTLTKTAPDGVTEYTWDDANRLVEQRVGGSRATYRYNADGLRIGQTTFPATGSPTRTDYLVDPSYAYANVIERFEGSATAGAAAPKLAAVFTFGEGTVGQTSCTPTATSGAHDCPAAQERIIHADGFGSTRYLTDASGAISDRIDYDAFGNEIHREGTTSVEHLYRGEQFNPNLGWYYLRARYVDPRRGRFASMDPFAGFSSDPMSLHKYLYAHADGVNGVDPSGYMTLSEASLGMQIAARNALATVARSGSRFVSRASNALLRTLQGAKQRIRECIRKPEKCDLDTPVLIEGNDTPETAEHVRDAQLAAGSNIIPSGVLMNRISPRHSRNWLRTTLECGPAARVAYSARTGSRGACDEFPYASVRQGGRANHPLRVSLRLSRAAEAGQQGTKLSAFYAICGIRPNDPKKSQFLAIGMPELPSFVLRPPLSCFDGR